MHFSGLLKKADAGGLMEDEDVWLMLPRRNRTVCVYREELADETADGMVKRCIPAIQTLRGKLSAWQSNKRGCDKIAAK